MNWPSHWWKLESPLLQWHISSYLASHSFVGIFFQITTVWKNTLNNYKISNCETWKYEWVTLYKLNILYLYIYIFVYAYIYLVTTIKNKTHEFKREKGWYIEGLEREKGRRKSYNYTAILMNCEQSLRLID